jgi:hypothetical protein
MGMVAKPVVEMTAAVGVRLDPTQITTYAGP